MVDLLTGLTVTKLPLLSLWQSMEPFVENDEIWHTDSLNIQQFLSEHHSKLESLPQSLYCYQLSKIDANNF